MQRVSTAAQLNRSKVLVNRSKLLCRVAFTILGYAYCMVT